ncbi:MAG: zinc-binding dehydrogenase [Deltaproteobacteria bacterium]|nr:zinc-binding dehydrogenase [Deltaproteobacteria bacterium]
MKAAVLRGPYDAIGAEVDKPKAGPGEILIKVKACGICGSDLHTYKLGLFPEISKEVPQGRIPGHEFSGDVAEVGEGVEGIAVGDRVTALTMGAMAEYVTVAPAVLNFLVFKLATGIGYEEAATNEPLATSLHAAKMGKPANGEQAVIFGAGIIGLGIVQCIKAMGVELKKLIVVDSSDRRLEMARKLGATDVINLTRDNVIEKVTEIAGTVPMRFVPTILLPDVDLVYDAVGYVQGSAAQPVIETALMITKEFARIVVVGAFEAPVTVDLNPLFSKEIKIYGSFGYDIPGEFMEALELIREKKVDRNVLISHAFPFEEAKEAFATQANTGESVKVIFKA